MKKCIVWVLALFIVVTPIVYSTATAAQEPEYAWVLVDVLDHDSAEKWEVANQHESYNTDFSCSEGTLSAKTMYIGKSEDWRNPPKIHGEAVRVTAIFSKPPEKISPDEEVTLSVTVSASENTLSFFTFGGSASANFDSPDLSPGSISRSAVRFIDGDGNIQFEVGAKNNYETIKGTFIAKSPRGKEEGERIAIRQLFYMGVSMGTYYIYEWRGTGAKPTEMPSEPEVTVQPTEKPEPTPSKRSSIYDRAPIGPKYIPEDFPMIGPPSGVDISDIAGEVYIHVWDENGYDWYFADLEEDLPINAIIQTGSTGIAVLSLRDMTTFEIPPNSIVAIGGQSKDESRLSILAGHVWTNFKSVIKDGSMDIEMSQAVAGIKGTTFILSEDGETSTVKVFEGEVEFKPHGGGKSVLVTKGKQVSATQSSLGAVENFNIEAELENWSENAQEITRKNMKAAQKNSKDNNDKNNYDEEDEEKENVLDRGIIIAALIVGLVLLGVLVFAVINSRKKKTTTNNATYEYYSTEQSKTHQRVATPSSSNSNFCQHCGKPVSENSKFCSGCGKPKV